MKWYCGNEFPVYDGDAWVPSSWNTLKEPNPNWLNIMAIPVSLLALGLTYWMWTLVMPEVATQVFWQHSLNRTALILLPALILIHELIHMLLHPGMGRSHYSVLGFLPKYCMFVASYTHTWTCRRFVSCLLAPLFGISLLPILLAGAGLDLPHFVIHASLANAFLSSGDIIGSILLLFQVPARCLVRNNGFRSYWQT